MASSVKPRKRVSPESLIKQVSTALGHHALWDSLLIIVPPVLALIYGLSFLRRTAWIDDLTFALVASLLAGLGLAAIYLRTRSRIPSTAKAARLADEKSGAKDHFLTLSTIHPGTCQPSLLERLRRDSTRFSEAIELKRDFAYQPKRSSYGSVLGSVIIAAVIYFMAPLAEPMLRTAPVHEWIRELAEKMADRPKLKGIAEELKALAAAMENPHAPAEDKQQLVQEIEKQIAEQQKQEQEKKDRDLLDQAANQLGGTEQQQSAGAQEPQNGGGGIQSNLPQENQGESKQSQGGSGENKADRSATSSSDKQPGKSTQADPKDPGQGNNQSGQGEAKNNQADPNRPGQDQKKQKVDKNQGGSKDGAGRNQASEEPPQNVSPAERFYKNGEGKEGLKGARYVTVQLPEDVAAETKGESMSGKESNGNRIGAKVPVSNMPLPAHVPNTPTEKQQLPIEYRGIIR